MYAGTEGRWGRAMGKGEGGSGVADGRPVNRMLPVRVIIPVSLFVLVVSCAGVLHLVLPYRVVSYRVVSYCVVSYRIVSYRVVSCLEIV